MYGNAGFRFGWMLKFLGIVVFINIKIFNDTIWSPAAEAEEHPLSCWLYPKKIVNVNETQISIMNNHINTIWYFEILSKVKAL
jgi:hypothetical protein